MLIIQHRVNTLTKLKQVPSLYGVEVDIRDIDGHLCLQHDPFKRGEALEDFLKAYRHSFIVLNVKTDGIEAEVLRLVKKYSINHFFLLDLANPTLVKMTQNGMTDAAVRFSEFEPIESCLAFAGKAKWVWVDCFTQLPLNQDTYSQLKRHFKICLVSPELQSHPSEQIRQFKKILAPFEIDAVCTDYPNLWLNN